MISVKDFRKAYNALVARTGCAPTVAQLQAKLKGATMQSVYCHLRRCGLPYRKLTTAERGALSRKLWAEQYERRRKKKEEAGPVQPPKQADTGGVRVYRVEPIDRAAIRPALLPGNAGGPLPGKQARMDEVRLVRCGRCARRFALRVKMHAWWVDAGDGMMEPVCSDACTGTPLMRKA